MSIIPICVRWSRRTIQGRDPSIAIRGGYDEGSMRRLAYSLILLLSLQATGNPLAAEHFIQPFVKRDVYQSYCTQIGIDSDQREIANLFYEDYVQQLVDLQEISRARAVEAGAERLEEAYKGRGFMKSDEIRSTRIAVQESYAENWPVVDRLFDDLISDTASLSIDPTSDAVVEAGGELTRFVVLESVRMGEQDRTYAGDGLDVVVLIEQLGIETDPSLDDVRRQYTDRMNEIVVRNARLDRASIIKERVAKITKDDEVALELMRKRVERWKTLNAMNQWAIDSVAYVLDARGDVEAVSRWRRLARETRFPWLHRSDQVELIAGWIVRNGGPEQQEKARAILDDYEPTREVLRVEFETLLLSARNDQNVMLGASVLEKDPESAELRAAHLRLTGELRLLESRTVERLETLLTPGQRAAARRSILD